jgi:hypothetical protein
MTKINPRKASKIRRKKMFGLSILSAHTIGFSVYRDKKIEKIKHKK